MVDRRTVLSAAASLIGLCAMRKAPAAGLFRGDVADGPFLPFWDSLKAYRTPDWFRDAKLGIWAHWTPQCVPERGDWYARNMYIQGMPQYEHHVKTYGHPSQFGYKDLCHLWKAERWDPEGLMKLYKGAGAEYFVAIANHHDNFDCWNSKYQPWNSVNVGPKRDIVGAWEKTARAHGLRFGVSYHGTPHRVWDQFLPVRYKSDTTGPLAGVPYDGLQTMADGQGKWWEGLDPQRLNGKPHAKNTPSPEFTQEFLLRVQDVIDSYDPDLLYFDDNASFDFDAGGPGAPDLEVWLGIPDLAPQIMAYFYNRSMQRHGGKLDAVMNLKQVPEPVWGTITRDFEAAMEDRIQDTPWQTDACIGHWHYDRRLLDEHRYHSAALIIPMFVDIVSKNGNLLLNIPLPGHGEPDADEMSFLQELSAWHAVNREAIKGTRPWKVHGEGPSTRAVKLKSYQFAQLKYDHRDIRFTAKGEVLYAIALGWPPDGKLVISSLAEGGANYPGRIGKVELLGYPHRLGWKRGPGGLQIEVPAAAPGKHAYSFRIVPA